MTTAKASLQMLRDPKALPEDITEAIYILNTRFNWTVEELARESGWPESKVQAHIQFMADELG